MPNIPSDWLGVKKNRNAFSVIFWRKHYSFMIYDTEKKNEQKTENIFELSTL